jgi:putative ABC transport system permease protein
VGVVPDIKFIAMSESVAPNVFMNADQFTTRFRVLAIKTDLEEPASLIPTIRQEIAAMAPDTPVEFGVYPDTMNSSISRERLGMALLAVFGTIALVLAAVGIYGVMAYSVTRRSREMAVRAAMGASASQMLGLVMRSGAMMAIIGIGLGLSGTMALQRVVESQLYGVSALDPAVLITVPLVLFGIALLASFLPAWRASKVDPGTMFKIG